MGISRNPFIKSIMELFHQLENWIQLHNSLGITWTSYLDSIYWASVFCKIGTIIRGYPFRWTFLKVNDNTHRIPGKVLELLLYYSSGKYCYIHTISPLVYLRKHLLSDNFPLCITTTQFEIIKKLILLHNCACKHLKIMIKKTKQSLFSKYAYSTGTEVFMHI